MKTNALKHDWIAKYRTFGYDRFLRFLLAIGQDRLDKIKQEGNAGLTPENELLEYYDQFLILYRRSGEEDYLNLAKIFRRAAHKIYRLGLKQKLLKRNLKFLQTVSSK